MAAGCECNLRWLNDNDTDGEPPTSPEMTLQMASGQQFLVTER